MTAAGAPLCRIVSDEELADPLKTVDSIGWLGGNIEGWKVLCLAGGGGRQSCLYAAAGARVTVVDLSPAMLELDRQAARQRNFSVQLIEGSMDDLSMLAGANFDLVIHPVSTCYLPDIVTIYRQVATVLRANGLYISQHKSPVSLQTSMHRQTGHLQPGHLQAEHPQLGRYSLAYAYYRTEPVPGPDTATPVAKRLREPGATEFLHRWEDMIGGLCRSGFVIEDLVEPMHAETKAAANTFADRANFVPPYVRIKARRIPSSPMANPAAIKGGLWLPGQHQ